jgi:hypothetical protein
MRRVRCQGEAGRIAEAVWTNRDRAQICRGAAQLRFGRIDRIDRCGLSGLTDRIGPVQRDERFEREPRLPQ